MATKRGTMRRAAGPDCEAFRLRAVLDRLRDEGALRRLPKTGAYALKD